MVAAHDVAAVTGACLMMQRRFFDEVQGFDEQFAVDYHDVDLYLKLRANGRRIVLATDVEMYRDQPEMHGPRGGAELHRRLRDDLARFRAKWQGTPMLDDPYFNPEILTVI